MLSKLPGSQVSHNLRLDLSGPPRRQAAIEAKDERDPSHVVRGPASSRSLYSEEDLAELRGMSMQDEEL